MRSKPADSAASAISASFAPSRGGPPSQVVATIWRPSFIAPKRAAPAVPRRAIGITSSVERQGAALDDHDARPRVRVPAKGPARRDPVLQHVEIGFTLGVDRGLPAARERLRVDLVEPPHREEGAGHPRYG